MKSITYMLCEGDSGNDLAREVDRALKRGWQLQGGVAMRARTEDGDSVGTWYAQAMTFEVDTES